MGGIGLQSSKDSVSSGLARVIDTLAIQGMGIRVNLTA
jgi:hypothetical protein